MVLIARQAAVVHIGNLRVAGQKLCHSLAVLAMAGHAHMQAFQAKVEHVGVDGALHAAKVTHQLCGCLCDKCAALAEFFRIGNAFSIKNWRALAVVWAILPIVNAFVFIKAPIASLNENGERGMAIHELAKNKLFWILFLMMICAGASEQGVSQWASAFAEKGLGVTKTVGDLAGPMAFACLMGISRAFYGKFGHKIELDKFMNLSCILCIVSYLTISLVPNSVVGLIGCALCGLSVGIMWPGSFSKASASIKRGGTALFALLALGGDLGCTAGPTLVGFVSGRLNDNMRMGILVGTIFPILLLLGIYLCKKEKARNS